MAAINNEYQLFYLSAALTRARRLEAQRESFHRELYAAIVYPTMRIDPHDFTGNNPDTAVQAIKIIETKERYEAMIDKEYSRFDDWTRLLQQFTDTEQILLIRRFQKKKLITSNNINSLMRKVDRLLQAYERDTDKQRTIKAKSDYDSYKDSTEPFRSTSPVVTKSYLIRGEFMKLSESNYENFKDRTGEVSEFII